ncbi:hypothetical protein DSL64_19985 [Dyadobacter luteus]|jgi:hypothetical protein|uniref:Uncharacterized protein n=1 Tax=Dyadobacter luteus TaxID=2259619 RepID=A0A3D8Y6Y2_9BACT|nr:hypothetical protein [Dyadobacter luteus]REA58648.1 hypothetical protein DSL64_19985 [Dyadobacter luteus]
MEKNKETLDQALAQLAQYQPPDKAWNDIEQKLGEHTLHQALNNLPQHQPADDLWEQIEQEISQPKGNSFRKALAAAVVIIASSLVIWLMERTPGKQISYSEEIVDQRLHISDTQPIDTQYENLKVWCETESVVCNRPDFKELTKEYETLRNATDQLMQAMGSYNAEPELVRQLTAVEQEKTVILNKMAKLI